MYGPRYEFAHSTRDGDAMTIVMRPACDGDAAAFAPMMSDPLVIAHLGRYVGQTVRDEEEFFDRVRTDSEGYLWILEVIPQGGEPVTIGTTSLTGRLGNRLCSGFNIGRPEFWNKGIAGATHELRTRYAFCELGAYAIDSFYSEANVHSGRALRRVGYVEIGRRPRALLRGGTWHDEVMLSCYNPATLGLLWPDDDVPQEVMEGAERTRSALERARQRLALP